MCLNCDNDRVLCANRVARTLALVLRRVVVKGAEVPPSNCVLNEQTEPLNHNLLTGWMQLGLNLWNLLREHYG
jgi:hypothetical protein